MSEETKQQEQQVVQSPGNEEDEGPVINEKQVLEEESERRRLMLEVIARSCDNYSKQKRKDIQLHKDDLRANEFETVPMEEQMNDSEATDSDKEKPSQPPEPRARVDVYIPTENSLVSEILMETQPLEKIEKNLFAQYLKALEPLPPGQQKRPLPKFLTKMLSLEQQEKDANYQASKVEFIPLFEKLHSEYKMDFDMKMARYFQGMIRSKGVEIYDVNCFDANIPPINSEKYADREFT